MQSHPALVSEQIYCLSCGAIIDNNDLVTLGAMHINQMRADETGTAGNQHPLGVGVRICG